MDVEVSDILFFYELEIRKKLHLEACPGQRYARVVVPEDRQLLYYLFQDFIEPVYGDQSKIIEEWINGTGHKKVFLLFRDDRILGFLSLKVNPEKDYAKISTLFVLSRFRGEGNGSFLLKIAENLACTFGRSKLSVTVSEERPEARDFFLAKGFEEIKSVKGMYKEGVTEYILVKRLV